ncbi:Hsp20/alpha crystallin family protein [Lewinella sp. IMCC34191]|uniref:Hsp20/alpha crystallin family protein n=1 Tax=Lewinella sp. IMCC34191 TaxID=2259172 RepID=UPI000E24066F|nr:Hsp20/alpha crystallin family protein [Lewinella sp. IMCC34191]
MKMIKYNRFPSSFRFFDDALTQATQTRRPAVNIIERDKQFELEMLAPGRQKELFNVDFFEGVLEVSYTTEKNGDETRPEYLRNEFELRDFTRKFRLNNEVINDEAIEATYTDGILRLVLPKREEATKPVRQIAVG